jgi:hypothetical protein
MDMWARVGVIAAVVAAIAALLALFLYQSNHSNVTEAGDGGACAASGEGSFASCDQYLQEAPKSNEEIAISESQKFSDVEPSGSGPWPFIVVRTRGIGLQVRTTNTADGEQIGTLGQLGTA